MQATTNNNSKSTIKTESVLVPATASDATLMNKAMSQIARAVSAIRNEKFAYSF